MAGGGGRTKISDQKNDLKKNTPTSPIASFTPNISPFLEAVRYDPGRRQRGHRLRISSRRSVENHAPWSEANRAVGDRADDPIFNLLFFFVTPKIGQMIQFHESFQMGWFNHQVVNLVV